MKKSKSVSVFNIVVFTAMTVFVVFLFSLLAWGVLTSLKTVDDALYYPIDFPKEAWMFSNFVYVIQNFAIPVESLEYGVIYVPLANILLNTIIYAGLGAFAAALVPMLTAYMCARFSEYKLSAILYFVVIVVMMIPLVGTQPAQIKLLQSLNLYDTYFGVILQKMSFTGTYFLVFYAMVKGLDKSYAEAAYMDGGGEFTVLFRIYFPLLINSYFTVVLLLFVAYWNDYNTPLLYMPGHPTLSYSIFLLSRYNELEWSTLPMRMTAGIVMVIPILILFIIFRDKITGNLTVGGVKG